MPDGNFLAHTSRPFEVAKKLRASGHEIIFAGEGQFMKLAIEEGFSVKHIKTIDPEIVLMCKKK